MFREQLLRILSRSGFKIDLFGGAGRVLIAHGLGDRQVLIRFDEQGRVSSIAVEDASLGGLQVSPRDPPHRDRG